MADKKKLKMTSPRGVAVYPKLSKPDTKFKAEGVYSIKLRVSEDEANALVEKLKPILAEYKKSEDWAKKLASIEKKVGKGKAKLTQNDWFKPAVDPQTDEAIDGQVILTFNATASGKKKDGSEWKRGAIATFDAKGTPLPKDTQVWGGSEVKVSFVPMPWLNPKGEYGVKLGLEAVQVLKLVSGGARDASEYGFEAEEGYEADTSTDAEASEGGETKAGDDSDGDDF